VSPTNFEITLSVSLLAAMVIGGSGTLMGAVWGGLILGFQDTWTGRLSNVLGINPTSNVGANLQVLVYGVLLIVLIMLAPGGIQRFLSRAWQLVYGAWLRRVKKIPTPT
jgi:branched-chain amino acid transport system permease protein